MDQEPPLGAAVVRVRAHQRKASGELVPAEIEVELAGIERGAWAGPRGGPVRDPGARIPDDDIPAAILAGGDDALEAQVLERVVLNTERRPTDGRIECRTLRDRPARKRSIDLEPKVVMQASGTVALDHEPRLRGTGRGGLTSCGLGGVREIPFAAVWAESISHRMRLPVQTSRRSWPVARAAHNKAISAAQPADGAWLIQGSALPPGRHRRSGGRHSVRSKAAAPVAAEDRRTRSVRGAHCRSAARRYRSGRRSSASDPSLRDGGPTGC